MTSTTDFFTEDSKKFEENYGRKAGFRDRLRLFVDGVTSSIPPGSRVLDFGCGPGVIALSLAKVGYEVVGLDGARGMIELCREKALDLGIRNASFELADAMEAFLVEESFDVVVCSSVLEYLPDDMKVLKQMVHATKKGGYLFVSVPNASSVVGKLERIYRASRQRISWNVGRHFNHSLRHYNPHSFQAVLRDIGCDVKKATYFELPIPGKLGVHLSRFGILGGMALYMARRVH